MKLDELRLEIQMWRSFWQCTDPNVKEFISRYGKLTRAVRRDYKGFLGVLLDTKWDLKSIDMGISEKFYDNSQGKYFFERKIIRLGAGQIINFEFIEEQEQCTPDGEPIEQPVETPPESE